MDIQEFFMLLQGEQKLLYLQMYVWKIFKVIIQKFLTYVMLRHKRACKSHYIFGEKMIFLPEEIQEAWEEKELEG